MPVINRATIRRAVAILECTRPDPERFDFGPAYEHAVREHAEVLRLLQLALRDKRYEEEPTRPGRAT